MDADDEREDETDRAIMLEQAHLAHIRSLRRHNRALVWIIVFFFVIHALYALALVAFAKRAVVVQFPQRVSEFSGASGVGASGQTPAGRVEFKASARREGRF